MQSGAGLRSRWMLLAGVVVYALIFLFIFWPRPDGSSVQAALLDPSRVLPPLVGGLLLLVVLQQVCSLIDNHRLAAQIGSFRDQVEDLVARRTEELVTLNRLAAAVNTSLRVEDVVAAAATHLRRAPGADAVVIGFRAAEGDVECGCRQGLEEAPELAEYLAALPPCEVKEVLPVRRGALSGHFLRAPLRSGDRLVGSLGLVRWSAPFGAADEALLESAGKEVGAALENARRYTAAVDAAERDPVTGLFNHRAVHQRLESSLKKAAADRRSMAVIMMDVNNFKLFNDTYGHPMGDQVLKRVAGALADHCREEDVLGRYGGDEFLLVLPGAEIERASDISRRLRDRVMLEGLIRPGEEGTVPISLSFGIAMFPEDGENLHELLTVADGNLYAAKRSQAGIVKTSEAQRRTRKLRGEGSFDTLDAMVSAVDNKDGYTRRHSEDVTEYALWIADELGLSDDTRRVVRVGAILHDVGKIGVPDEILRKPSPVTDEEYEIVKHHATLGGMMVAAVPGMEDILDAVRHHHERWDGTGYPDRLRGEDIPFLGRLMAVADAFSAMTTDRPFRGALTWEAALEKIRAGIGRQFDPVMAEAFLRAVARRRPEYRHLAACAAAEAPLEAGREG